MKKLRILLIICVAKCHVEYENQVQQSLDSPPCDKNPIMERVYDQDWNNFKELYNKVYNTIEEDLFRKQIFVENRNRVVMFNEDYATGKARFVQQLNSYGDLAPEEFNRFLNGFNQSDPSRRVKLPTPTTFIPSANALIPERIDWREAGAVTRVKMQDICMSCYAFSAAGSLEGQTFRKTGKLVELSPQNIVDCSTPYSNTGCSGGQMTDSFEYVKNQPGLDTYESYPYEGKEGACRFNPQTVGAYCTGYVELPEGDEKALEIAVATVGPVSVAIDAGQKSFQFYKDGVYNDPLCKNKLEDMNHGVLIIGYGVESGLKYWLVKNSYGSNWGDGGYIKIAKDVGNQCGIANLASYPLV